MAVRDYAFALGKWALKGQGKGPSYLRSGLWWGYGGVTAYLGGKGFINTRLMETDPDPNKGLYSSPPPKGFLVPSAAATVLTGVTAGAAALGVIGVREYLKRPNTTGKDLKTTGRDLGRWVGSEMKNKIWPSSKSAGTTLGKMSRGAWGLTRKHSVGILAAAIVTGGAYLAAKSTAQTGAEILSYNPMIASYGQQQYDQAIASLPSNSPQYTAPTFSSRSKMTGNNLGANGLTLAMHNKRHTSGF